MKLKKIINLVYPFFVFPVVFLLYIPINQFIVLKWLGSGGPIINSSGITRMDYFSANDFSRILLAIISMISIFLSIFNLKKIPRILYKILYLIIISLYNIFCYYQLVYYTIWK
jgi:hypothetical protein